MNRQEILELMNNTFQENYRGRTYKEVNVLILDNLDAHDVAVINGTKDGNGEIVCPACGKGNDLIELIDNEELPVTAWEDENVYGFECRHCEATVNVMQEVFRSYLVLNAEVGD